MIFDVLADLKRDEGYRQFVYDDATGEPIVRGSTVQGHPTIGYGLCVEQGRGRGLSQLIASMALEADVKELILDLAARAPWLKAQPDQVRRACIEMSYELGVEGLLGFVKMIAALQNGDLELAAKEALDSDVARKQPARYRRMANLIRGRDENA